MSVRFRQFTLALLLCLLSAPLSAVQAGQADELMMQSHLAYYYAGDGGRARVAMTISDPKGRTREREFWILRRDIADMGDQRYYTYFLKPADVARTAFLVHKKAEANDDRWLYIPALDLVKRIAADDRHTSFVGSDFSYEDISGRLPALDSHEMGDVDSLLGRVTVKVKSSPIDAKTSKYAYKLSWIDQDSKLPLREDYFDKNGDVVRRFSVGKVETIDGILTATERTMTDLKDGRFTTLQLSNISYTSELKPEDFNERLLKNPPVTCTR